MSKFDAEEAKELTTLSATAIEDKRVELLVENNIRHEMHRVFVHIRDACVAGDSEVTLVFNDIISGGDFNIKRNKIKNRLDNLGYIVSQNVVSW